MKPAEESGRSPAEAVALAIWEADRHLRVLRAALGEWSAAPLADAAALEADPARLRLVDQILFRLSKLQDALGERLIPATLAVLAEPFEAWPMRDRLQRLEKLGFIEVAAWLGWRAMRNRLAHEYPEADAQRFAAILAAISGAEQMASAYVRWRALLVEGTDAAT